MTKISFMAFAKGKESKESNSIQRFVGITPVTVLAVNPDKKTLEELYNTTLEDEPKYISEIEVEGTKIPSVRVDFIVKSTINPDFISKITFFIRKEYRFNRDKTKVQVIDKYGRTAWVTKDELNNHIIPVSANGNKINVDKDYRPCYRGEEDITKFFITYLEIPSVMKYNRDNGTWYMSENTEDSIARLDNVEDYFKGDFSELKTALSLRPNNKIKAMFGVRTTSEGNQYQTCFTELFLKLNDKKVEKFEAALKERKDLGAYPNAEFYVGELKPYNVEPTDFASKDEFSSPESTDEEKLPWE